MKMEIKLYLGKEVTDARDGMRLMSFAIHKMIPNVPVVPRVGETIMLQSELDANVMCPFTVARVVHTYPDAQPPEEIQVWIVHAGMEV